MATARRYFRPRTEADCGFRIYEETSQLAMTRRFCNSVYGDAAIGVVMAGSFGYRAKNEDATVVPGTVVFGNCKEEFRVTFPAAQGNRRLVVRYGDEYLQQVGEMLGLPSSRFAAVVLPPGKAAAAVFSHMRALVSRHDDIEDAAFELAAAVLRLEDGGSRFPHVSGRDRKKILEAVRHIQRCYAEPCTVESLATISGFSRFHFSRLFKAVTGQSPNQYLINTRLRAAAVRLMDSRTPISTIALDVGFNCVSHFNNHFRDLFECTPRQMRKRLGRHDCDATPEFELIAARHN